MGPVYARSDSRVGAIVHGRIRPARRAAYRCDITYCTNKELTFDYLRDRIALAERTDRVQLADREAVAGRSACAKLILRGLFFAIVDEADSVLVDEARTPLIISGVGPASGARDCTTTALRACAAPRARARTFVLDASRTPSALTDKARTGWRNGPKNMRGCLGRAAARGAREAGVGRDAPVPSRHALSGARRQVQIIDEFTGRILADRTWEQGLHQMVEAKEGCRCPSQQTSVRVSPISASFGATCGSRA